MNASIEYQISITSPVTRETVLDELSQGGLGPDDFAILNQSGPAVHLRLATERAMAVTAALRRRGLTARIDNVVLISRNEIQGRLSEVAHALASAHIAIGRIDIGKRSDFGENRVAIEVSNASLASCVLHELLAAA